MNNTHSRLWDHLRIRAPVDSLGYILNFIQEIRDNLQIYLHPQKHKPVNFCGAGLIGNSLKLVPFMSMGSTANLGLTPLHFGLVGLHIASDFTSACKISPELTNCSLSRSPSSQPGDISTSGRAVDEQRRIRQRELDSNLSSEAARDVFPAL